MVLALPAGDQGGWNQLQVGKSVAPTSFLSLSSPHSALFGRFLPPADTLSMKIRSGEQDTSSHSVMINLLKFRMGKFICVCVCVYIYIYLDSTYKGCHMIFFLL